MPRIDVCPADDFDTRDNLLEALASLGFQSDDASEAIGVGLTIFHRGEETASVYVDAWQVDFAASEGVVREIVARLSSQ
ncbi:MAG: hypothetical protein ACRC8S_21155 [Fimbriiglobus sp.]